MNEIHRRIDTSRVRDTFFYLSENTVLTDKIHLLRFVGDTASIQSPGQFVMLELPSLYLRRPFSVCDWDEKCFTVLVERIGTGTELLHRMPTGTELSVLTGLGNGFSLPPYCKNPVLIGGGSGLSPLVGLSRRLMEHKIYALYIDKII